MESGKQRKRIGNGREEEWRMDNGKREKKNKKWKKKNRKWRMKNE